MGASLRSRQFRKDRSATDLRVAAGWQAAWQVYCDDFDVPEVFGSKREVDELKGEMHEWQRQAEATYDYWQAARSADKAGHREFHAVRLGAFLDGLVGRM